MSESTENCSEAEKENADLPTELPGEETPAPAEEATEGEAEGGGEQSAADAAPELLCSVVEAILFASQKPVSVKEIQAVCRGAAAAAPEDQQVAPLAKPKEAAIRSAVASLGEVYQSSGRSFEIQESASGFLLVSKPAFAPWLRQLFPENRSARLSAPAMETLAIIAYRQPITRADVEAVRGVAVDGVVQTLLDRGLVKIAGRAEVPGRPLLYETTQFFLEHFGIKDLSELPNSGELRRMELPVAKTPDPAESTEAAPAEPGSESVQESDSPEQSRMEFSEQTASDESSPPESGETPNSQPK